MLFLKTTQAPVAPGLYMVEIAAKPPGRTFAVYLAVDGENLPEQLLGSLENLGYKRTHNAPYVHQDGKKVVDQQYSKAGSDIFEGWTATERDANLRELESLFAGVGVKIEPRVMSFTEAF